MSSADRIETLFDEAVQLPRKEWPDFLARSADSPELKEAVEQLLEHHLTATDLFDLPAIVAFPAIVRHIGQQFGEFHILRELGRGGMAVVYLAEDRTLDRQVALKVLNNELAGAPQAVERFQREARAAARLDHPGIVPVYRFGEDHGTHFLAMQFVPGETLDARIRATRSAGSATVPKETVAADTRVPDRAASPIWTSVTSNDYIRESSHLVCAVAHALDYAHNAGVLHRDVKPSNILLDTQGVPRIADFGIAKFDLPDVTSQTQEAIGTWRYMSPEQSRAEKVDRRTDVFSLGVVLYELLTLEHPFLGGSAAEVMDAVRTKEPPPVRSLNPAAPKDLETICHKALEKRRTDRYPTAAHLAADLECHLRGDPILARPPGAARRATRWLHRHRVQSIVALIVTLVASLAAVAGMEYQRSLQRVAHVSIEATPRGSRAEVFVRAWDMDRRAYGPAISLGAAATIDRQLSPGQYRFIVVTAGGAFVEFDEMLTAGQLFTRSVDPSATSLAGSEMVSFEPGPYTVRVTNPDGTYQDEQVALDGFMLDITEVSNAQYKEFVDATHHRTPEHWDTFGYDLELALRPVVSVTIDDAQAYCAGVGKRLPTAVEWEAAARSPDGRLYPWGELDAAPPGAEPECDALVNAQSRDIGVQFPEYRLRTRGVDEDEGAHTANGLRHLRGNVMELTSSPDRTNPNGIVGMGGAWLNHPRYSDLRWTFLYPRDMQSLMIGFRCARASNPQQAKGRE